MKNVIRYGVAYFAVAFAVGFVLGTLRTVFVVPRLGDVTAVLIEVPFMLALSWWASGWLLRPIPLAPQNTPRLLAGAIAFALLLMGEAGISVALAGLSLADHVQLYQTPPVIIGLIAQIIFALCPLLRLWR